MTEYFSFRNRILKEYLILSTIFVVFFVAVGRTSSAYGFILGAVVSGINFYLISLTNLKLLQVNKVNVRRFHFLKWFFLRYFLYALALTVAFEKPFLDFGSAVLGLFSIQLTLLISKFIYREN
jgi:hypothetical protein